MKALVLKELRSVFCSATGAFFALSFSLVVGGLNWLFPGSFNFIDVGFADMKPFFSLAPILLTVLIPTLTMRLFSEEKQHKTLDVLKVRPVKMQEIFLSKFLASFIFVLTVLFSTAIYVYSLYKLSYPIGNIDSGSIMASYISLILISVVFLIIGLFGSAITKNQVVAFIISVAICLFAFWGFDLLSNLFSFVGKAQSLGLSYHYRSMQRGVVYVDSLIVMLNYILLFTGASLFSLQRMKIKSIGLSIVSLFIVNILFCFLPTVKLDCTSDKRYTLSEYSTQLLERIRLEHQIQVITYLDGDLNYSFQRLQTAVSDILADFNRNVDNSIGVKTVNPYEVNLQVSDLYESMAAKGMEGIMLNEMDREGKASRKVIYPYVQITNGVDTLVVPLLKNIAGNTAEENINASIESLEFEFIDAIGLLTQHETKNIAFIEGHEELSRAYLYDAEELLSKYYTVNRGQIGNDIHILDNFDAIIIAGPLKKYTEQEKYIIDQYIMKGGKVLWLIDGAYYSHEDLLRQGFSASMKNDVNLDDLLFNYGIRINADLLQDEQCIYTYIITDEKNGQTAQVPSYFQPLLMPSQDNPITKNIKDVKSGFVSSIDVVNNSADVKKEILLTSSGRTHLLKVPEMIDFDVERIQIQSDYFNQQYVPVAVSLEGSFNSIFINRLKPDSLNGNHSPLMKSRTTKMIVVSSSDIISNEIQGRGEGSKVLPMGYDRVSQQQFGNREFIVNAMNWLIDGNDLMLLRTKKQELRMLDRKLAYEKRNQYTAINILSPVLFIILVMGAVYCWRKRKYES